MSIGSHEERRSRSITEDIMRASQVDKGYDACRTSRRMEVNVDHNCVIWIGCIEREEKFV